MRYVKTSFLIFIFLNMWIYSVRACDADTGIEIFVDIVRQNSFESIKDLNDLVLTTRLDTEKNSLQIRAEAAAMGGHWLGYGKRETFQLDGGRSIRPTDIVNVSDAEIDKRYRQFLRKIEINDEHEFDGHLILDLEHPIHPKDFTEFDTKSTGFNILIKEINRRVSIARNITPRAKFSLYGFPTGSGRLLKEWPRAVEVAIDAAKIGLFDNIDCLVPILYARLRESKEDRESLTKKIFSRSFDFHRILRTKTKTHLCIYPLLSNRVYNGKSSAHREKVSGEYYSLAIEYFKKNNVKRFGIWLRPQDSIDMITGNTDVSEPSRN